MASSLVVLLSLVAVSTVAIASPVPAEDAETTTAADEPLVDVIEVVEIPVLTVIEDDVVDEDATTQASDAATEPHKVEKRSVLRGDNPSNDLLADLEGLRYENGLTSLTGRRIKFLPTWLG